ncbi:hypothetical protein MKW98_005010 [Papaver atlanticum]|uniref:Trichome birefringence-like N-terminal domain-containing protein n=1 Tax=Papaver atlanticum TaxID=357466 RepID=A0AAD4TFT7_9MAGN|nr:hypothetical protein MKW98_005010 [Papaver atlanticum]
MVKYSSLDLKPGFIFKQYHVLVKLTVAILVIGLAFHLFYSSTSSTTNNENDTTLGVDSTVTDVTASVRAKDGDDELPTTTAIDSVEIQETPIQKQILQKEKCDLSVGEWIPDPSGPMYTYESCNVISYHQNCMKNGRPDSGFLYWRWKPRDCELPRFNAVKFLDSMRNKHWAFVGDSISRNHLQSLYCLLSKVEAANEVDHDNYNDEGYRDRRWHFPSHNFTLSVIWSPFLVKAVYSFVDMNGVSTEEIQLYLDEPDKKWTDQYMSFDYMVISAGKWFMRSATYYENGEIVGCHYCPGKNLTEYGLDNGYRKAIKLVLDFITSSNHNASVFYRSISSEHFVNGNWDSGGTCDQTSPSREGELSLGVIDEMLPNVELEAFVNLKSAEYSGKRETLKVLNITELSLLRPDGHPGPYRSYHPFAKDNNATVQYDCIPGPIDSWSDLVLEMVMNG